jgi:prevent-host-death family protein
MPGDLVFDIARDIMSLSDFKRHTTRVMRQMKKSGDPIILTVNGKAEIVVQDAAAYQRLTELAEKARMLEFLREAKEDADAERTVPAREFLESLGKKKRARKR